MMDELDDHYEPKVEEFVKAMKEKKPVRIPHTFSVGDLVAAVWHHDQLWYRGVVKAVKEEKYEVFFLDYGDTNWVMDPYIWPLDSKFCIFPTQAIRAKLSGTIVSPVNASMTSHNVCPAGILPPGAYEEAKTWSREATARMLELTKDSHKVSLNVIVMDRGEEVLGVWLIDRQGEG